MQKEISESFTTRLMTGSGLPKKTTESILKDINSALSLRKETSKLLKDTTDESKKTLLEDAIDGIDSFITNITTFTLRNGVCLNQKQKDGTPFFQIVSTAPAGEENENKHPLS